MRNGYVFLWRELLEKPIWRQSTPEQKTILITILLLANHAPRKLEFGGRVVTIVAGQFITSLEHLALEAGKGISVQNVRGALKRFEEKFDFSTSESTNTGRIITIKNWGTYQACTEKPTDGPTGAQQAPNKHPTTNKNIDNNNNNTTPPTPPGGDGGDLGKKQGADPDVLKKADTLYGFFLKEIQPTRKSKRRALKNLCRHLPAYEARDLALAVRNYKTVMPKLPEYRKDPANFFGVNEPFFLDYLPGAFIGAGQRTNAALAMEPTDVTLPD